MNNWFIKEKGLTANPIPRNVTEILHLLSSLYGKTMQVNNLIFFLGLGASYFLLGQSNEADYYLIFVQYAYHFISMVQKMSLNI